MGEARVFVRAEAVEEEGKGREVVLKEKAFSLNTTSLVVVGSEKVGKSLLPVRRLSRTSKNAPLPPNVLKASQ